MNRIYETGDDTNQITFGVKVGTTGTANTSAVVQGGSQPKKIAESNEDSGSISEQSIGNASDIRNSFLVLRTSLDLSNTDKSLWPGLKNNLVVSYHLNGGLSGRQVYNHDKDDINTSPDGKTIVVTKAIELR
ncbi:MAG: hypothetical protein NTV09_05220 [Bacteroidetes bacterium]|nr:hypothetical protein [Bacteroidota bacterium]